MFEIRRLWDSSRLGSVVGSHEAVCRDRLDKFRFDTSTPLEAFASVLYKNQMTGVGVKIV